MQAQLKLLTIDEVAAKLRVSRDWVRKAIKTGTLDGTKVGTGTLRFRCLVSQDELDRYVKQQTRQHDRELLSLAKMRCRPSIPVSAATEEAIAAARVRLAGLDLSTRKRKLRS